MKVELYKSFIELPLEYRKIWEDKKDLSIFNSFSFYQAYELLVLSQGQCINAHILVFVKNNEMVAILPLLRNKGFAFTEFKSLTNFYFPSYNVVFNEEYSDDIHELHLALLNEFRKVDSVDLLPIYENNIFWQKFEKLVSSQSWCCIQKYHHSSNWYQSVDNVESYFTERPERLKNTLRRRGKKLKSSDHSFQVYIDSDNLEKPLQDYWRVYKKSWKIMEPYPEFINSVVKLAASESQLRLGILSIQGKPTSCQIWFVKNKIASIFKLAYDPEYTKLSVGSLLTEHMIKYVCVNDEVNKIDFLNGNDPFKKDWMGDFQTVYGLRFLNKRKLVGRFLYFQNIAINYFKKIFKKRRMSANI